MLSCYYIGMAKALAYVRVSTGKQAEHGMSLEAQEAKVRAWATMTGHELTAIIVDAASASTMDRPGFQRVLEAVDQRAVDCVVVAKLDRMTRSVADLAVLMERFNAAGVEFASIAETLDSHTAAGRMVMNIIATVGQWERETISERTRECLAHLKANGRLAGNVPYGKRRVGASRDAEGHLKGGHLEDDPGEQSIIQRIWALRGLGESYRDIADILNEEGCKTRVGKEFRHQYVANILNVQHHPDYTRALNKSAAVHNPFKIA